MISKGFSVYIYDYKFDDLSTIAYNTLLHNMDKYKVKPHFYVINLMIRTVHTAAIPSIRSS